MSILVGSKSKVIVQGITGREGSYHAGHMLAAGTDVVGGTSPGNGGQSVAGLPVFDTVAEARTATGADTSVVFVPARFARDAIIEAGESGIAMVVCITEGIPVRDVMEAVAHLSRVGATLIGPNCPGIVSVTDGSRAAGSSSHAARSAPGSTGADTNACNAGIMPADIFRPGPVGLVSRSGTLTYEIVDQLTRAGIGQSTCVGIGGDAVHGVGFVECLELFEADEQTAAVVLIGEIGGDDEERAADYVAAHVTKPVVAYIAGFTAPPGKTMGHAGAIISGNGGTATAKAEALEAAGISVARRPSDVAGLVRTALEGRAR